MLTASFDVLHDRFARLALGNVHLERLYTGCRWSEGPVYVPAGRYLLWSDIPNDRVMRWNESDGSVSVFQAPAFNANGHTLDRQGRVITCEHRGRCVSRIEHDGSRTVLASHFNGRRLNSPNDVWSSPTTASGSPTPPTVLIRTTRAMRRPARWVLRRSIASMRKAGRSAP